MALLAFLLAGGSTFAQSLRFERLTINDGLSQSSPLAICQDRRGFLWIGTEDGLNRFDGHTFKIFRHDPDNPNSLSANDVRAIVEDRKGVLWIGTNSGGLNRFDPQTERFTVFRHDPEHPHGISSNVVWSITCDRAGILWIGTDAGLNRLNPMSIRDIEDPSAKDRGQKTFRSFQHDPNDPESLSHNTVMTIAEDAAGILWIGTFGGGLNRLDPAELTTQGARFMSFKHQNDDPQSLSENRIMDLVADQTGRLWIGTFGGLNLLKSLDLSDPLRPRAAFEVFSHSEQNPEVLSDNMILDMCDAPEGRLWVGTFNGGLNLFDPETARATVFRHNPADPESLGSNAVTAVALDRTGLVWVGAYGSGLNRLDPATRRFSIYRHNPSQADSLSFNSVMAFLEDQRGRLWIGGYDGGLNLLTSEDAAGAHFTAFNHNPDDPNSLPNDAVWALAEDPLGRLWVGTFGGGVSIRHDQRFYRFSHRPNDPHSLSNNHVREMLLDADNLLWIGTNKGLNRLKPAEITFQETGPNAVFDVFHGDPGLPNQLNHGTIMALHRNEHGPLWIGSLGGGLNRLKPGELHKAPGAARFSAFTHHADNPHSLSHDDVIALTGDRNGRLWIGTSGGLNMLSPNDLNSDRPVFRHYFEKDGLINNAVFGILEDQRGLLWISTSRGLSRFDPGAESFKNFDASDGLQSNEFNGGAFYKNKAGRLFFGGISGFNAFNPKEIEDDRTPPPVAFTNMLLFNQPVPVGPSPAKADDKKSDFRLARPIHATRDLTLSYQESLVSFEFAALQFARPKRNQYAYKMENLDADWIYTDYRNRRATYTNLPAGEYTLRVKAANKDGFWNETGTALRIRVTPPPWKSWWAVSLYVLAVCLVIAWFIWIQRRKFMAERAVVEKLRQVDQLKDEFLANTSHELRTPLNGIIGLAESMMDGVAGAQSTEGMANLAMIASSGRRLANLVNDILDFSKLKNRGLTLHRKPVDLTSLTDVVIALSKPLIGGKPLTLHNQVPNDLPAVFADENRVLQILLNLVNNAVKFTASGKVTVSAAVNAEFVRIRVSDTGIGIPEEKFEVIFQSFEQLEGAPDRSYGGAGLGLAVSKQLVNLHGGAIWVESKQGRGSTFFFTLPVTEENAAALDQQLPVSRVLETQNIIDSAQRVTQTQLRDQPQPPPEGVFKILIVDDEPVNLQVMANHLTADAYHITRANNGREALAAVQSGVEFDLVLLDIMMPRLSGYEVCRQIRHRKSVHELPIIYLSAKDQVADLVQGFATGANDYLTKPISKGELLARVNTHLQLLDTNRNLERKVAERTEALNQALAKLDRKNTELAGYLEALAVKNEELAQKNDAILRAQNQLVINEKMATLGTLTAGVAHEFNNPNNFISGGIQAMEAELQRFKELLLEITDDDGADPELIKILMEPFENFDHLIQAIHVGSDRIDRVVRNMGNFSRLDEAARQVVDLREGLQATIELIRSQHEYMTFHLEAPEPLVRECSPAELNQVFLNLILNACHAVADRSAQDPNAPAKLTITVKETEDGASIIFTDTGCGIPEAHLDKIFEAFFTTREPGKGTGLGLYSAWIIMQKHNGVIEVQSYPNQGATFTLRL